MRGEEVGARVALAEAAGVTDELSWLPWLAVDPATVTVDRVLRGSWRPSRRQPFPPGLSSR